MVATLAAIALVPLAYRIPQEKIGYTLEIGIKGAIHLLGADFKNLDLKAGITVQGLPAETDGNPRATTDIQDLKVTIDDVVLPFTKDSVSKYFPNTVTMTPQGKVLKNDAPSIELPVQLPGLDVRRFPDITFLVLEFPAEGVEEGKEWTYSREFGSSLVQYVAKAVYVAEDKCEIDIKLSQEYKTLEDENQNVVKDKRDAAAEVDTKVDGSGRVTFDRRRGLIRSSDIKAAAVSTVTGISDKAQRSRNLTTEMKVSLQGP